MTQAELADGTFTRAYISLVETGRTRPSLRSLETIASRLGVSVGTLLGDPPSSRADVAVLCNLARGFIERNEYTRARELLEAAADRAEELGDWRLQGLVKLQYCRLSSKCGDHKAAWLHGTAAYNLFRDAGAREELAQAAIYLANVQRMEANPSEAEKWYRRALHILEKAPNPRLRILAHWGLGNLSLEMERVDEARRHYQRALDLFDGAGSAEDRAAVQMGLALTYRDRGELEKALELSVKALQVYEENDHAELVAGLYNNIASIQLRQGDRGPARRSYQKALELVGRRCVAQAAEAYRGLARLDMDEGQPVQATEKARAALEIARTAGVEIEEARCCLVLAEALTADGAEEEAIPLLKRAKEVFAERGIRQSATRAADLLQEAERGCG